jgi:hypothetical protein
VEYGQYANLANAQTKTAPLGGAVSAPYVKYANSLAWTVTPQAPEPVADVLSAGTAFSKFTGGSTVAELGTTSLGLVPAPVPFDRNGAPIGFAVILANTSTFELSGNFSVLNTAGNGLYLSAAACPGAVLSNSQTKVASGTSATLPLTPIANFTGVGLTPHFCYQVTGTSAIPASAYTVTGKFVANSGYELTDTSLATAKPLASILRNGTELQAPLGQVNAGWGSRLILTNTGATDRPFSVRLMNGNGNTVTTGPVTSGTIPAGEFMVQNITNSSPTSNDGLISSVTGGPQGATVIVTVAGPNEEIQGLYQLWQVSTGNITNIPMIRPGTN